MAHESHPYLQAQGDRRPVHFPPSLARHGGKDPNDTSAGVGSWADGKTESGLIRRRLHAYLLLDTVLAVVLPAPVTSWEVRLRGSHAAEEPWAGDSSG